MTQRTQKTKRFDRAYMRMAVEWSMLSQAQRRRVGALIVKDSQIISDGFNGSPSGFKNACEDDEGLTLPHVLHAESNAITKLARSTQSSVGATMYVTTAPCFNCAKLIIQAGITKVIYYDLYTNSEGIQLLHTAGVETYQVNLEDVD